MEVHFEIVDFGAEAESLQAAAAGRVPEDADHLWGAIVLDHDGQPPLVLRDDLQSLARPLCGLLPPRLRSGQPASLSMAGWPGSYRFEPQPDGQVRIIGSEGEDASFPQEALLQALQACGLRLAACMRELADRVPQFGAIADELVAAIG